MQCKDIPDMPILKHLAKHPSHWHTLHPGYRGSIDKAMPPNTPANLVRAKMKTLISRGLVDGCACGCRGDFEISDKGLKYIVDQGGVVIELPDVPSEYWFVADKD